MTHNGLPKTFWLVLQPAKDSMLADICYDCDLKRFAAQVRGGLDENRIVGVYADGKEAEEAAEVLLGLRDQQQFFYVATMARYVLVDAASAREALELGEARPELNSSTITTVRLANKDEISLMQWHAEKLAKEQS